MSLRKGGKRRWELSMRSEKWIESWVVRSELWKVVRSEFCKVNEPVVILNQFLNIYIKKDSTLMLNPSVL
jgi:hypothetical protein